MKGLKGLSVAKNCLRLEIAPLKLMNESLVKCDIEIRGSRRIARNLARS